MAADLDQESGFDPRRRLCPDGDCIGIVGSNGKCSVCGTMDPGGSGQDETAKEPAERVLESDSPSVEPTATSTLTNSDFDPNRRLCSDDTCIGVMGDDNRCKLCGKNAIP